MSIKLGRSNSGVYKTAEFTQGNLNLFLSPFKNQRQFDFRIGAGVTFYNISDAIDQSPYAYFRNRSSFGYNIIVENSYLLTNKFLIGIKLFTQPYFNGDINTGILFKAGVKI